MKEELAELDISKFRRLLNILNCLRNGFGTGVSNYHECFGKGYHHHLVRFVILD